MGVGELHGRALVGAPQCRDQGREVEDGAHLGSADPARAGGCRRGVPAVRKTQGARLRTQSQAWNSIQAAQQTVMKGTVSAEETYSAVKTR